MKSSLESCPQSKILSNTFREVNTGFFIFFPSQTPFHNLDNILITCLTKLFSFFFNCNSNRLYLRLKQPSLFKLLIKDINNKIIIELLLVKIPNIFIQWTSQSILNFSKNICYLRLWRLEKWYIVVFWPPFKNACCYNYDVLLQIIQRSVLFSSVFDSLMTVWDVITTVEVATEKYISLLYPVSYIYTRLVSTSGFFKTQLIL